MSAHPQHTVRIDFGWKAQDDGRYVPDDALPFTIEDAPGTMFNMDGIVYELVGDLGGHAVYRRRNESTLRTMTWADFAHAVANEIIEIIT
jgi:hypothetical protein